MADDDSEKFHWNHGTVRDLIANVRENDVVWNPRNSLYSKRHAQDTVWRTIAENIGLPGKQGLVKSKWRDLRDTLRKKLKSAAAEAIVAGDSTSELYCKWVWMENMEFIKNVAISELNMTPIAASATENQDETINEANSSVDTNFVELLTENSSSTVPQDNRQTQRFFVSQQSQQTPISLKRSRQEFNSPNTVTVLKGATTPVAKETRIDEDTLFLSSLLPQIKRLDSKKRAYVKCQIQQLLFKVEFGDDSLTESVNLSDSENQ